MSTDSQQAPEAPFMPRWVFYLAVPAMVGPALIFGFILLTESAHDEDSCPYRPVTRRALAQGVELLEETRRCIPDVEERRYSVVRGDKVRVLGTRRLHPKNFVGAGYHWDAAIAQTGEAIIKIENEGQSLALFREGTDEERRTGIPNPPMGPAGDAAQEVAPEAPAAQH